MEEMPPRLIVGDEEEEDGLDCKHTETFRLQKGGKRISLPPAVSIRDLQREEFVTDLHLDIRSYLNEAGVPILEHMKLEDLYWFVCEESTKEMKGV